MQPCDCMCLPPVENSTRMMSRRARRRSTTAVMMMRGFPSVSAICGDHPTPVDTSQITALTLLRDYTE